MSTAPPTTLAPTTAAPTTLAPTTVAPTTAAPTTLATTTPPTTLAPTTFLTTLAPTTLAPTTTLTTAVPDTDIDCDPVDIILSAHQLFHHWPPLVPEGPIPSTLIVVTPLVITLTALGEEIDNHLPLEEIVIATLEAFGRIVLGEVINAGAVELVVSSNAPTPSSSIVLVPSKTNWVMWSKVGFADFTQDQTNEAGERPMDWKGTVYEILKLGENDVVVYGDNGVTVMRAAGVHYGMKTIYRIGAPCKSAIVGTDTEHYFVDRTDKLCKVTKEGLVILDYSEYLSTLSLPIRLVLDIETGLLYIMDGTNGFVYSTRVGSMGVGPGDVTGIGPQTSELYVLTNSGIEIPKFYICTDIYDLGIRKPKTIQTVEVGTDLTHKLQVKVEARISNKDNFISSRWVLVNPSGIAYIPCYGVEFKFHLRSYIYEYLELDYLRISGVIHGYGYVDAASQGG